MASVDDADERALKILAAIAREPREVGPMTLSPEYRDAIAKIESLPQNQAGADKSWVHLVIETSQRMYARAVLKR